MHSITQVLALYMLIGAIIFFLSSLPSIILPVINVVLTILYVLFVYNIIQFKTEPQVLVSVILFVIAGFALIHTVLSKRKFGLIASAITFISSLTAALIYTGFIKQLKNLENIKSMIENIK